MKTWIVAAWIAALSCTVRPASAQVLLPSLWTDHAVVQRDQPVRVWGLAAAGEQVTVRFRGNSAAVAADEFGQWHVELAPGAAGGPFAMEIEGSNRIRLNDLMVGDVWVASGQSNMEFTTRNVIHADAELQKANYPNIRLFHVQKISADYPQYEVKATSWTSVTPQSVADFSAVAYFFATEVQADQKVPIGLIEADWGGTPAEAWTSQRALSADGSLMAAWGTWADMTEKQQQTELAIQHEARENAEALAAGKPQPQLPYHPELRSYLPGGNFNGMIAPLTQFPIRGVIWYQGESNAGKERSFYYARLFRTMIEDWRNRWAEGDFPFLFVQLANFETAPDAKWPELRDDQRRSLSIANTAMASAIDIGTPKDIHPKNKQEVGHRLALAARAIAYHESIEYSGPLFDTAMSDAATMRVFFSHTSRGLEARGSTLTGFEVAGADGVFTAAMARVDGNTVVASAPAVPHPRQVRYGWAANPACNLYNGAGLPASPFTTSGPDPGR
jgi:sialate O-acetylesterase